MDNLSQNVESTIEMRSPRDLQKLMPLPDGIQAQTVGYRNQIVDILSGACSRRLVILGPCSIHDTEAAFDYAKRIHALQQKLPNLLLVMRVYFEKPRTTIGWKGFINDPNLDNSFDMNLGLTKARDFLIKLALLGIPTATEFLDPITPKYFRHLFSWGAIGARTLESQLHREMASGLPMPVGFKNSTSGGNRLIANAIESANNPHSYLGIDDDARLTILQSKGNPHAHTVLRGNDVGTNYDQLQVHRLTEILKAHNLCDSIIVDCSHANCSGDHALQPNVARYVFSRMCNGQNNLKGIMLESFIEDGKQRISEAMEYGKSVTDACISIGVTEELLYALNERVQAYLEKESTVEA